MILGCGMDLCKISRIARAIERERFLTRVYTPREQSRILSASDLRRGEIAAGLFAGKEAAAKALGTGFTGFGFADIEILPDESGRPECYLYGGALARADCLSGGQAEGVCRWRMHISISHEAGMASAMAILES